MFEFITNLFFFGTAIGLWAAVNCFCAEVLVKGIVVMLGESHVKHGWFGRAIGGAAAFGAAHIVVLQFLVLTA